jgi:signal transduction histidine kinase
MDVYGFFVLIYMELKRNFKLGYYVLSALLIIVFIMGLVAVFIPYSLLLIPFEIAVFLLDIFGLISIYYVLCVNKKQLVVYYAYGQTILFVSLIIFILTANGLLPYNFWTRNALYYGIICEAWFFLMAINDRVLNVRKEKYQTELALLEKTLENQTLLAEYAHTLEHKVEERTEELRILNQNLYSTNIEIEKKNKILSDQSEVLSKLNATKDKIFSIITHDLRNPFFVIGNLAEMSIATCSRADKPKLEEFSHAILKSSRNASALLENLSEWIQSQSKNKTIQQEQICIDQIVEHGISFVSQLAINKNISIQKLDMVECEVLADRNMANTVMRNLLTNAIKFSFKGGRIFITCSTVKDFCEVSIQDEGVGISDIHKEKLFQIDQNYQTLGTEQEKGTGLGLMICKELVDINGGTIWVESVDGKGSVFKFTLPIWCDDEEIVL